MKITAENYFIIGLLFVCFTSFKQLNIIKPNSSKTLVKTTNLLSKDSTGYINGIFLPAKINNSKKTFNIRYNVYKDEMEIKENDAIYFLPKNIGQTIYFQSTNKVFQVFSVIDKAENKKAYFILLFGGTKLTLLLKERIDLHSRFISNKRYIGYLPPTFKHIKGKLYVGYKNNTSQELPKKKKDILKLFSYKSKEVELFANNNNYGFKKQKDLIELFKFYDSLK